MELEIFSAVMFPYLVELFCEDRKSFIMTYHDEFSIQRYIDKNTGCPKKVEAFERFLRRSLGFKFFSYAVST